MKMNIKLTLTTALIFALLMQPAQAVVTKKQIIQITAGVTAIATLVGAGYYWWKQDNTAQVNIKTQPNDKKPVNNSESKKQRPQQNLEHPNLTRSQGQKGKKRPTLNTQELLKNLDQ